MRVPAVTTTALPPATPASAWDLREDLKRELGDDPAGADVLARWDRWGPDLLSGLARVYDEPSVAARLVHQIAMAHRARPTALRDRDRARILAPDWFQRPDTVGYAAYTERFAGDLPHTIEHIAYLRDLGVTYLHLMPLLQTRSGANDGGYAVSDYDEVRSDLGTMDDLEELATRLHAGGISLTLDLVLNHVAREHRWAQAARDGDTHYRDYFWTFGDRELPDAFESTLTEVFPQTAPGSFTWDPQLQRWVWTTFNTYQWDLNWSNADVLCEFVQIILNLANRGVDCLRLDAIAFLWKRLGTNCQNQPEVHAITQALRAAARIAAPALIFKAEAIVPPSEVVSYFGRGEHAGRLSDLAYHNSFMVQIWSALATRDARLMATSMSTMKSIPTTAAWATYLRCHDDIGWAIDDADCARLGWNGWEHRNFLCDFYTGEHESSFAQGTVFEKHPVTGDRRINGTSASLCGMGRNDQPLAVDRLLCAYAMVMGLGGVPLIFMGDEIALCNDYGYANDPHHRDDNRWLHRPLMPWQVADEHGDFRGHAVYDRLRHLIDVRKHLPSLHASVATEVHTTSVDSVVCFVRHHPAGDLTQVYNVADHPVSVPAWEVDQHAPAADWDVLAGHRVATEDGYYQLGAYQTLWLARELPSGLAGDSV